MGENIEWEIEGYLPNNLEIKGFECEGEWSSIKKDEKIPGVFEFSSGNGGFLKLEGEIDHQIVMRMPFIYGLTNKNEEITLTSCRIIKKSSSQTIIHSSEIFFGSHLNPIETLKEIYVNYSNLKNWINNTDTSSDRDIKLEYPTTGISYPFDEEELKNLPNFNVSIYDESDSYIKIKPLDSEYFFSDYNRIINHIQNYFSLAVGEPVYPLWIKGITERDENVDIYIIQNIKKSIKAVNPHYMAFTLDKIDFEYHLINWFRIANQFESTYRLYFENLFSNPRSLEQWFLNLAQAIEAYYEPSNRYEKEFLSQNNYRKKIYDLIKKDLRKNLETIIENIFKKDKDDEFKKGFRENILNQIKFGNKFSLNTKLNNILDDFSDVLSIFDENKDEFISKFTRTRNYLTHSDPNYKRNSSKGDELSKLTFISIILLELLLFKELDYTCSIRNHIYTTKTFRYKPYDWNYLVYRELRGSK